jgi:hypothetical protein
MKRACSLIVLVAFVSGCAKMSPEAQTAAITGGVAAATAVVKIVLGGGKETPTPEPRPRPTPKEPFCDDFVGPTCNCWRVEVDEVWDACGPVVTPLPSPTVIPMPVPTQAPELPFRLDQTGCKREGVGRFHKYVRTAVTGYKDRHPERFEGNRLAPVWRDGYYFEVVATLNAGGFVKAVVDDCGHGTICGEIAVKDFDTLRGTRFHEQYHILVSSGDLRYGPDSYRATCEPSGF